MNINNTTPWNTEDLTKYLTATFAGLGVTQANIELMAPRTSRWRKREWIATASLKDSTLNIELLSPKRAAARSDTLDRLSLAGDLKKNETRLPVAVIAMFRHGVEKWKEAQKEIRGDRYALSRVMACVGGYCSCDYPEVVDDAPIIRGDTAVKTHTFTPASEKDLQEKVDHNRKMRDRCQSEAQNLRSQADRCDAKAETYQAKINKLEERIIKLRAAEAMSVPLSVHGGGEEDGDGDEDQQEAE